MNRFVRLDPSPEDVERIVREEASARQVSFDEVIGRGARAKAVDARRSAVQRILAETGCSARGVARVWGMSNKAADNHARALEIRAPYDSATYERLVLAHGAARAKQIVLGEDPQTQLDLAKWRTIGSYAQARPAHAQRQSANAAKVSA